MKMLIFVSAVFAFTAFVGCPVEQRFADESVIASNFQEPPPSPPVDPDPPPPPPDPFRKYS